MLEVSDLQKSDFNLAQTFGTVFAPLLTDPGVFRMWDCENQAGETIGNVLGTISSADMLSVLKSRNLPTNMVEALDRLGSKNAIWECLDFVNISETHTLVFCRVETLCYAIWVAEQKYLIILPVQTEDRGKFFLQTRKVEQYELEQFFAQF